MPPWAILLVACGCNQVLGIGDPQRTPSVDAQFFDAPVDAPFSCPPIGTVPAFSLVFHQIVQNCQQLNGTASSVVTRCFEPADHISQGPIDGPFVAIPGVDSAGTTSYTEPRIAPEGDELFVHVRDAGSHVAVYHRNADDTWTYHHDLSIPSFTISSIIGTVSRGPVRHMMINNSDATIREISFDETGVATDVANGSYGASDLGQFVEAAPNLTADGLRIVYQDVAVQLAMYNDRPSIDARFSSRAVLVNVPAAADLFMTEDCGRIYFSGSVASVLWVQRQ